MPASACPVYSRASARIFPRGRARAINRRAIFIRESFRYGRARLGDESSADNPANEQRRDGGTRVPTHFHAVADLETRISINALWVSTTHNFEQSRLIEARCLVNVSFGKRDGTHYRTRYKLIRKICRQDTLSSCIGEIIAWLTFIWFGKMDLVR